MKERKDGLNVWMKAIMPLCEGDRNLAMFLAQDGSVDPEKLEKLGLGNQRKGMDSSQEATKVTLSAADYAKPSDHQEDLNDAKDFMAMARDMELKQKDEKEAEQTLSLADRLAQDQNAPSVEAKQPGSSAAIGSGDGSGGDGETGDGRGEEDDLDAIMSRFMGTDVDASVEVGAGSSDRLQSEPKITMADADYAALAGVDASIDTGGFALDDEEYAR
eukprot:COSAG02_NODE_3356_length_6878_cov_14.421596_8_plen_217_part_00